MSNLVKHAQKELEIAGLLDSEKDFYGGVTGKAVLDIMETFSKQGHSGASAPLVASLFKELSSFGVLSPLTGEDDEWNEIGEDRYQNNRHSAVFKEEGRCYYIDGIIKQTPNGTCWSGSFFKDKESFENRVEDSKIYSTRCYIKEFPFTPKKFYIDVEEVEVAPDYWEMYATNPDQLKEVEEYYDLK